MDKINSRKKKIRFSDSAGEGHSGVSSAIVRDRTENDNFWGEGKTEERWEQLWCSYLREYLECFIVVWNDNDLASEAVITILCH